MSSYRNTQGRRKGVPVTASTRAPDEGTSSQRTRKTGPSAGPWASAQFNDPPPTITPDDAIENIFAAGVKGCASSKLTDMAKIPKKEVSSRSNKDGQNHMPSRGLFNIALAGIQKAPSVRARRDSGNSSGGKQMSIRGTSKTEQAKKASDKGKGKASESHTIDLTSDNETPESSTHGPCPTTNISGTTIHRRVPAANSQDLDDDPLTIPCKTKGELRPKRRPGGATSASSQANLVTSSFPLTKSKSPAGNLRNPLRLKGLYLAFKNKLFCLPLDEISSTTSHVTLSEQQILFTGRLPNFDLKIEPENIKVIFVNGQDPQTRFILQLGKEFSLSIPFSDQLKGWLTSVKDTNVPEDPTFFVELNTKCAGFSKETPKAISSLLESMCGPDDTKPNLCKAVESVWKFCDGTWKTPGSAPTKPSPDDQRQDLLKPAPKLSAALSRKTIPMSTRAVPPAQLRSRTRFDKSGGGLPFEESQNSSAETSVGTPADSPVEDPSTAVECEPDISFPTSRIKKPAFKTSTTGIFTPPMRSMRSSKKPPSQAPMKQPELDAGDSAVTVVDASDSDIVLVWPYENAKSANSVAITRGDLKRLEEGEFLNDTLIEFGLNWELEKIRQKNQALCDSIHLFNSFFYQKLSKKHKAKNAMEESKLAYNGVQKWTKRHDLFLKDFVVIPINEHMHWYLMIVVKPGEILEFKVPAVDTAAARPQRSTRSRTSYAQQTPETDELAEPDETVPAPTAKSGYFPNQDEIETTAISVETSTEALGQMNLDTDPIPEAETEPAAQKDTTNVVSLNPSVLTLDSLASAPHRPQGKIVLRYFVNEARAKKDRELPPAVVDTTLIKQVEVPEQPNFCDCGLYLIHAFKIFFQDPDQIMDWISNCPMRSKGRERDAQFEAEVRKRWDAEAAEAARVEFKKIVMGCIPGYEQHVQDSKLRKEKERVSKEGKKTRALIETNDVTSPTTSTGLGVKRKVDSVETRFPEPDFSNINSLPQSPSNPAVVVPDDEVRCLEGLPGRECISPPGPRFPIDEEPGSPSDEISSGDRPDINPHNHMQSSNSTKRRRLLVSPSVSSSRSKRDAPMLVDRVDRERRSHSSSMMEDVVMEDVQEIIPVPSASNKEIKTPPDSTPPSVPFHQTSQTLARSRSNSPNLDGTPIQDHDYHDSTRPLKDGLSSCSRPESDEDYNPSPPPIKTNGLQSPLKRLPRDSSRAPIKDKVHNRIAQISPGTTSHAQARSSRSSRPPPANYWRTSHSNHQPMQSSSSSKNPEGRSKPLKVRLPRETQAQAMEGTHSEGVRDKPIDLTNDHDCQTTASLERK